MTDEPGAPTDCSAARPGAREASPAGPARAAAGLLEWEARTGTVRHCPRYPGLLGWGACPPEAGGEALFARVRPEDREHLAALRRGLTPDAPSYAAELRVESADGREAVLVEHGCGLFDEQGRLVRVIGAVLEASAPAEAARAAWEPERSFLRTVIDAAPSMIFVKDGHSRFVLANQALARCYGTTVEDLVGKSDIDFNTDADEVAHFRRDDREVLRTRQGMRIPEEMVTCADGQTRWFSTVKVPLVEADGSGSRLLGVATDITTLKEAEAALRERVDLQDQLTRIAATVPGVICSFLQRPDGSACFPYASPAIEDIYGVPPPELARDAAPAFALLHPDDLDHVRASIEVSRQTLAPWRDEFRVRNPSRGEIWVEGHSVPQPQVDGGTLWTGFIQEVTERKRLEQALRDSERLYRAIGESIDYGVWVRLRRMGLRTGRSQHLRERVVLETGGPQPGAVL
jgi:PAS domain S-box-containing protein